MIIPIQLEKAHDKIQHPFLIKNKHFLNPRGSFPHGIKISLKSTADSTFISGTLEHFDAGQESLFKLLAGQVCSLLWFPPLVLGLPPQTSQTVTLEPS